MRERKPSFWMLVAAAILCMIVAVCFLTNEKEDEPTGYGTFFVGDLDLNGQEDYYIYESVKENRVHGQLSFYMNEEKIYTCFSESPVLDGRAEYLDVDGDRRKEIFFQWNIEDDGKTFAEYFLLDMTEQGWQPLEIFHGKTIHDNGFPISMTYGSDKNTLVISCGENKSRIFYDLTDHYKNWEGKDYERGKSFGSVAGNRIHSLKTDVYNQDIYGGETEEKTCLIATHQLLGIEGTDDVLGNLHIYFSYDEAGNVQILDLQMDAYETETMDYEKIIASVKERSLVFYYDEERDDTYRGIWIQNEKTGNLDYYDWVYDKNTADYYYPPEVKLLSGNQHLLVQFVQDTGSGIHETEAHVIDLNTMKEISVENPKKIIAEELEIKEMNFETGALRFNYDGKTISEKVHPNYLNEYLFPEFVYSKEFRYDVENDTLSYTTSLQAGPACVIGELKLQYTFKNGEYRVSEVSYESINTPLAGMDTAGNEIRMQAYEKSIERLKKEHIYPDDNPMPVPTGNNIPAGNGYEMMDIDGDGHIELIINCPNLGVNAGMFFHIYDYDVNTKQFHLQFSGNPEPNPVFYDNGIVIEEHYRNQSPCDREDFWPYAVYQYKYETDTYEIVEPYVGAWEKSIRTEDFPHEKDLDKDGLVYYFVQEDGYSIGEVFDNAEHQFWKESLIKGAKAISLQFQSLASSSVRQTVTGDFDGNDLTDQAVVESRRGNGRYQNVLRVILDNGLADEVVYEGRTDGIEDFLTLKAGKLRYSDRDCIVLEITDAKSNYASTDIHVLSVYQDPIIMKLVEEVTILDGQPEEDKITKYKDTLLGAEENSVISIASADELIQKADKLNTNAVQIWDYRDDAKMYLYWNGSSWKVEK